MPCFSAKSAARPASREPTAITVPAVRSRTASANLLAMPPGARIPHDSGGASCGSGTASGIPQYGACGLSSPAVGLLVGGHEQVHEDERLPATRERVPVERWLGGPVPDAEALLEQPAPLTLAHREHPLSGAALRGHPAGGEHVVDPRDAENPGRRRPPAQAADAGAGPEFRV